MPQQLECLDALLTLARVCAGVEAGESALIVTDTAADSTIVDAMATVLRTLGAEDVVAA